MLDKAIIHGREHRKTYHGTKAIDVSCRNHGTCEWCKANRLYATKKRIEKTNYYLKNYLTDI